MGIATIALIEKTLLLGRWDSQILLQGPTVDLVRKTVSGALREVLTSSAARDLFQIKGLSIEAPLDSAFQFGTFSLGDSPESELSLLTLAVACLHAFVQVNWTGPDLDLQTKDVLFPEGSSLGINDEDLNTKALAELAYGGEPAYHLVKIPIFLRIAQLLLAIPYRYCQSAPWWQIRAALVHQQILDEPVALPTDLLTAAAQLENTVASNEELLGRLFLERGLVEHLFVHDKAAADFFILAAKATGLQYELSGALGRRTKFQQTDLSQLVLLAQSHLQINSADGPSSQNGTEPTAIDQAPANVPETLSLNDDTLLERTEFTHSSPPDQDSALKHLEPSCQPALHPLDQCILLSLCLNVKNTSPAHGLTSELMAPYVARVISHPQNWSVHTMALLLRSRLESSRTRTVERSALQLQALIDQMPTADSPLSERLLFFHSIPLPSHWEMERELALRYLTLGVVKSALEIFERLEMWEEVVKCWQAMERRDKGILIIRDLLEGRKEEAETVLSRGKTAANERRQVLDAAREAKLWCILGDLEPDEALAHYERAWTVSKETSGRAMRSLGGYYFARGNFKKCIPCLKRAVAINPLLSRSWFILGCAYVREEYWEGAKVAFSRCVAIDDEDGESWNNLASVYLRMGAAGQEGNHSNSDEPEADAQSMSYGEETANSIPFSNKMQAFRALKQGLKFSYENWRMWSNYMIVAMDVGELSEACRAQARIVEEAGAKMGAQAVDEDVLDRLVSAVTRAPANSDEMDHADALRNPNEGHDLLKRVLDLFERTILPRISSSRIFRAYARLLTWQSRWEDAVRAYLDGYRCSTAGSMVKDEADVDKWREAVGEVEEIVDILRNFGPRAEGSKWRLQARSIVRTFIGRTKDFEDEPEWTRLITLQDELRNG